MLIHVISLGCDKNRTDTETILGLLDSAGHIFTDDPKEAELIIINTCCFIGDAKEESIQTIIEAGKIKEDPDSPCRFIIVCGCLAQRYYYEMEKELPEADAVLGTTAYDRILEAVSALEASGGRPKYYQDIQSLDRLPQVNDRLVSTGGHYAYLKISEGCNKRCSYCVIPNVRGNYRSYPKEFLISQARKMAEGGVKELILVAQETDLYGIDLYGKKSLAELLRELNGIEGLVWIRVLYCYPEEIDDELIDAIAECEKVVHYLDIPIQHASDEILSAMGRKTTVRGIEQCIKKLRKRIPDIVLRTTLMTGFPGETRKQFGELQEFIKKMKFDRLGVFPYSREDNTPAFDMPHQVPENVARKRADILMKEQKQISSELMQRYIGKNVKVFVVGYMPDMDIYIGRTAADIPDVDGNIFFTSDTPLVSGEFVDCRVTEANDYDLIGECHESAE